MTPSPPKILPLTLQLEHLHRIFSKLNPDIDPQRIDWDISGKGPLDPTASFGENHQNMENAYPQYTWFETDKERAETKEEAIAEYADFLDYLLGLAVLPEAREEMKPVLERALSDYRYRTERNIETTTLRKRNKELEKQLLEAKREGKPQTEIIEKEKTKIRMETERPKIRMTKELERKLRDIFEAAFTREGLSPRRFLPEYRLELDVIKTLTTQDDMVKAVEEHAKEIIRREQAPPIKPPVIRPPRPLTPPRERIIGLPPEEEAEEFYAPVFYPPVAMSEMRFPRRPAGIEIDQIYAKFENDLLACGIAVPRTYRSTFELWENHTYDSWKQMRDIYELMVQKICKGQTFTSRDLPARVPYEAICEGVYWLVSQKWAESVEDIVRKLDELGTPATRETVKDCIRTGWREKVPNFVIVTKEYLEHLLAEPLELES